MHESSCCGHNSHLAESSSDKSQSCCNNKHIAHVAGMTKESSCCRAEHRSSEAVLDPVCGMTINPSKTEIHLLHKGEDYYFCNSSCRDSFVGDPEKYLSKTI